MSALLPFYLFFFFNDTATTEIYTLSLHDALPIWRRLRVSRSASRRDGARGGRARIGAAARAARRGAAIRRGDRKSTRLNSSHLVISYAVFCLKKKKKGSTTTHAHHHTKDLMT